MQPQERNMPIYNAYPPFIKGDLAIGIEKFADMVGDIYPLHCLHYEETEKEYLDADIDPNYEHYMEMEKDGRFVCVTLRYKWHMVGYLQYYVFRDQHSRHMLQAREDAFYILPEFRSKGLASPVLEYAENAMKYLGCSYIGMTSKAPVGAPDIGPFLQKRGYNPVAVYYAKKLED